MEKIDIKHVYIEPEVLKLISSAQANRMGVLPISVKDNLVTFAVRDIADLTLLDLLEDICDMDVYARPVTDIGSLDDAIHRYYPKTVGNSGEQNSGRMLQEIINMALQIRASDIHIDPKEFEGKVCMRIDGKMRQVKMLDKEVVAELVSVIKVESFLNIAEKRVPQDGVLKIEIYGENISLRVATIPTIHGEHVTMRLMNNANATDLASLNKLGLSENHFQQLSTTLMIPNGIIIISGPTGSGKTTTLYAALRFLRELGEKHLVSLEDPVEMPVEDVTQVKIDSHGERVTFNAALRSVLRHDPDVILLGEIRDNETADIAVKAAMTGHLVLSTVHTNTAIGVFSRLLNLGVPRFLLVSTLRLAVAQRLVRCPCKYCMTWRDSTDAENQFFGWESTVKIPEASGCSFCGETGYSGRIAVYEMVEADAALRIKLEAGAGEEELAQFLHSDCDIPNMKIDGAEKILRGLTTVSEVKSVITV